MVTDSRDDELDKQLKEAEEYMEKKTEENLNSDDDSSVQQDSAATTEDTENQSDTEKNGGNQTETEENQDGNTQQQQTERAPDGVSRAYNDVAVDEFDTKAPQDKKEKEIKSNGSITPPKRDRGGTKGKSGGDNIMEVFWNDCIMAFYAWGIDAIVDNTLDFAEWVLFAPYKSGGKIEEKEEKAKKNIYMIGEEFYKERIERFSKEKEKLTELNENLAKEKDGIAPTWTAWEKEPNFYKKLCQINEKALEDPQSPEAEFMRKYGLGVDKEIIDGRFAKEEKIFTIATRLATIEEVISEEKNTISPAFSEKIDTFENKLKGRNANLDQFKAEIAARVLDLQEELGGDNAPNTEIKKKLEEIKTIAESGSKISGITKDVSKKIKEIKNISKDAIDSEDVIKTHIQKRSQEHYKQIMENIDKIHEANKGHPDEMKECIKQYLTSINKAGKEAKEETDKIITKNISDRSKHKKAKEAVSKISEAINGFMLNGEKISERAQAAQKDEFTLTEKQFSQAIREYGLSR